ncbi:alpha-xenorhabdolysin family binary toxin subunit B [Pseudomonas coronafaciens]|uniref:alpha-xenorhabdolysin family binary toxin subunit B n=1 Tax=Pseudomonas coronafaciens TaxID=53409 RepID=UPI000EFE2807|nr:alpha-xenorhabdolysin family binary toxin subunit B [Pseudomonas coronafaciens]
MIMSTETLHDALVLTPPDTKIMAAAHQSINVQVTALKLEFLPVIKEKMRPLQTALTNADKTYREKLATVTVQLNSINLHPIDLTQQQIEADNTLSDEQKQQAFSELNEERAHKISNLITAVRNSAKAIAERSDDVLQINLTLDGNRLPQILQQQIDTLTQRAAGRNERMSEIAEDLRLLNETIKTFEAYNLVDRFKEILPTPEELELANLPSPHIAAVSVGIARLGKLLDKLSTALTYKDLTEERDRLRLRYNALLDESRLATQETKATQLKLDELAALASVDQSKMLWVQEVKKVYQSLYSFLDQVTPKELPSASISQNVEQLKVYIKSFYSVSRII